MMNYTEDLLSRLISLVKKYGTILFTRLAKTHKSQFFFNCVTFIYLKVARMDQQTDEKKI